MKKLLYLALLSLTMFTLSFCISSTLREKRNKKISGTNSAVQTKNIAVLELFTSQGCSSCPPADRLLGTYASKENVIPLSFHVDYWDRLGWKDPFSSKAYTKRQYGYASALKANVYTPQLVINGQTEMIGSDAGKIAATLHKIFAEEPTASLSIKKLDPANGKVNINFSASGKTGNSTLNIALVEKKVTTEIKAGENGGVTLTNFNVVTNFKTINKVDNGENNSSIDIPASADLKNMFVVVFLQQNGNNKILAADQATF